MSELQCPHCGRMHPEAARFCPHTGREIVQALVCQECGKPLQPNWAVCGFCGRAVEGRTPIPTPPAGANPPQNRRDPPMYQVPAAGQDEAWRAAPRPPHHEAWENRPPQPPRAARAGLNRRTGLILAAVGIPLTLLACVVILFIVDALTLHVVGRLLGRYDPAAEFVPADAPAYVGVNFLNLPFDQISRLSDTMEAGDGGDDMRDLLVIAALAPGAAGMGELAVDVVSPVSDFFEAANLDPESDLVPWVGQYAGIGITSAQYNAGGSVEEVSLVLSLEARSRSGADDFLRVLRTRLSDYYDTDAAPYSYRGVEGYRIAPAGRGPYTLARSGSMVLVGIGANSLEAALDAKNGSSIADNARLNDLVRDLPRDRMLSIVLNYKDLRGKMGQERPNGTLYLTMMPVFGEVLFENAMDGMAAGMRLSDEGLTYDYVLGFDDDLLTESQRRHLNETFDAAAVKRAVAGLPEGTSMFIAGSRLDLTWENYKVFLGSQERSTLENLQESLGELEQDQQVNLERDLLQQLSNPWVMSVAPAGQSLLPGEDEILDARLAVLMLTEVAHPENARRAVEGLLQWFGEDSVRLQPATFGEYNLMIAQEDFTGTPLLAFGADRKRLILGSGNLPSVQMTGSLNDTAAYRRMFGGLGRKEMPVLYLDVNGLRAALQPVIAGGELPDWFNRLQGLAISRDRLAKNRVHYRMNMRINLD